MQNPTQRIALVTGANKGIGFAIARVLAQSGMCVLLGARNRSLGEAAAADLSSEGLDVRFIELDLERPLTLRAAAQSIEAEFQKLDVLVNNAGVSDPLDGPPSQAGMAAVKRLMQTNFFGTLELTQLMLPLIRKSSHANIVNVSSELGSLALNSDPDWRFAAVKLMGYNASKAAVNMLTIQLAYELRDQNIRVNSADPGFTATDLNGHMGTQTVEQGAAEAIRLALLPAQGPTGSFSSSSGVHAW